MRRLVGQKRGHFRRAGKLISEPLRPVQEEDTAGSRTGVSRSTLGHADLEEEGERELPIDTERFHLSRWPVAAATAHPSRRQGVLTGGISPRGRPQILSLQGRVMFLRGCVRAGSQEGSDGLKMAANHVLSRPLTPPIHRDRTSTIHTLTTQRLIKEKEIMFT